MVLTTPKNPTSVDAVDDERLSQASPIVRLFRRPEIGALMGAVAVYGLFSLADGTANNIFPSLTGAARWSDYASSIGIVAVMVALLMIGGEFDLSAGVMIGSSGLVGGLLSTHFHWGLWPSIAAMFFFALTVGFINGYLVVKTGLPSFIVTLAMFFSLRGLNLGLTKALTDTVRVSDVDKTAGYHSAHAVFASEFWQPYGFKISVLWWIGITIVATWILSRTRFGNWIYAVGGDKNAARNTGVPVKFTKIMLFIGTSLAACLVGVIDLTRLNGIQAGQGVGDEFLFIIAAVVGGCLLTGGYGSAIGASIGASIIGMAFIGIAYAGWNTDWTFLFLGVILFLAVLVNTFIGRRAQGARK